MSNEKRKSKRTDITAEISLRELDDKYVTGMSKKSIPVNIINISKDGLAFKSAEKLTLNSIYDTVVCLNGQGSFEAILEIVRMENYGDPETTYGCRFIGINSEDQFKIDVYQIVYESTKDNY